MRLPRQPMKTIPNEIKKRNMTREAFIRKWLANPQKQYNEQCRDEMRDDLDLVIEAALSQPPVSGSLPIIEQPILIGHLNKVFGYNGFNKIEIGTPVYLFQDRYCFKMTPVNGGKVAIQRFYKEALTPFIDFLSNNS